MLLHIKTALVMLLGTFLNARKDSKIFGGVDCDVARYPFYMYMEYFINTTKFMCGGSLLTVQTVLTAGHCCADMTSAIIYSGYYRNTHNYDQMSNVSVPGHLHPKYNTTTLQFDVCILKLEKPFRLTKRTRLVTLTPKKKLREMMENENETRVYELKLMGYGVNKNASESGFIIDSNIPFQCTNSFLKTQKKCLDSMRDPVEKSRYDKTSMFCHYNPVAGTKGSCEGDSGSPIMYANAQVGLISWGPNEEICTDRMEVSPRLDAVYDWIVKTGSVFGRRRRIQNKSQSK